MPVQVRADCRHNFPHVLLFLRFACGAHDGSGRSGNSFSRTLSLLKAIRAEVAGRSGAACRGIVPYSLKTHCRPQVRNDFSRTQESHQPPPERRFFFLFLFFVIFYFIFPSFRDYPRVGHFRRHIWVLSNFSRIVPEFFPDSYGSRILVSPVSE